MIPIWIIIIVFAALTAFNVYYLFYFKSQAKKTGGIDNKDNYYKLDAKIELLKYLALGLISIAALFGFSKFSDLSKELKSFENIIEQHAQLQHDYEKLSKDHDDLKNKTNEITALYTDLLLGMKDIDIEFFKQNQKIKDVTRQIPESNIRLLTKQLIETNLRDIGTKGLWIMEPDTVLINKELIKSKEMLRSAGYTPDEIEKIIEDIKSRTPAFK